MLIKRKHTVNIWKHIVLDFCYWSERFCNESDPFPHNYNSWPIKTKTKGRTITESSNFNYPSISLSPGWWEDYKRILHKEIHKVWDNEWKKYIQYCAKFYGSIQPQIPRKHWITTTLSRRLTTLFIRLRMGICQTPQYLHRIEEKENPLYSCEKYGNLDHTLMLECAKYKKNKSTSFTKNWLN